MESVGKRALKKWGEDAQIDMTIEEAAELIVSLRHFQRNRVSTSAVAEELADMSIMIDQMSLVFGGTEYVTSIKRHKLKRLEDRLNG